MNIRLIPGNKASSPLESKGDEDIPVGDMQFYDNYLPSLEDGAYTVTVTPSLGGVNTATDLAPIKQNFTVQGPRFNLDSADVHAIYPAPNSTGIFETTLPYMIFNKRTLPWERGLSGNKKIPWLALMVLTQDELGLTASSTSTTGTLTRTVNEWYNDTQIIKPDLAAPSADEAAMNCQVLPLTTDLFLKIAPALQENSSLAHCRQINTGGRKILGLKDDGWFSVVYANRLPNAPTASSTALANIVHLVSLEGLEKWLDPSTPPTTSGTMQLISLFSWIFNCSPELQADFESLMSHIVTEQESHDNGLLKLPTPPNSDDPSRAVVTPYLENGFTPLLYRTRKAEQSLAWYRGVFTPIHVGNNPLVTQPSSTGVASLIYDKNSGTFDMSYTAAYQIGRMLALADANYVQALMQFRMQQHQAKLTSIRKNELQTLLATPPEQKNLPAKHSAVHHVATQLPNLVAAISSKNRLQNSVSTTTTISLHQRFLNRLDKIKKCTLAAQDETVIPDTLLSWLQNMVLLNGVPFQYIIPNPQLLPDETIRFFYVDPNWIDRLLDGALSLGVHTQVAKNDNDTLKNTILSKLLIPQSGFLLRSSIVATWPNLVVTLTGNKADGTAITVCRQDKLANNVMLYLCDGSPTNISVAQPQEQLCFGVEPDKDGDFLLIRQITSPNVGIAYAPEKRITVSDFFRTPPEKKVLKFKSNADPATANAGDLLNEFQNQLGLDRLPSPAEVALQFMQAPLGAEFKAPTSTASTSTPVRRK